MKFAVYLLGGVAICLVSRIISESWNSGYFAGLLCMAYMKVVDAFWE